MHDSKGWLIHFSMHCSYTCAESPDGSKAPNQMTHNGLQLHGMCVSHGFIGLKRWVYQEQNVLCVHTRNCFCRAGKYSFSAPGFNMAIKISWPRCKELTTNTQNAAAIMAPTGALSPSIGKLVSFTAMPVPFMAVIVTFIALVVAVNPSKLR